MRGRGVTILRGIVQVFLFVFVLGGSLFGLTGPGTVPRVDPTQVPLGVMPTAASLVGILLADRVTPPLDVGGSSTPPAGGSLTPPAGGSLTSSAITTFNLLPLANPVLKLPVGGAYVGEGMPPVPAKLAARIRRWEYVEMGELLPEFWIGSKAEEGELKIRTRQGQKVSNIFTWLQSYGLYVAVLAPSEPQVIPELMAYMGLILSVSQDYEGLGWVRYDSAFRRQAALTGNKKWSVVNATLFAMNFSGRMAGTKRCELCYATTHTERDCPQGGNSDPDLRDQLRNLESALLAIAKPSATRPQSSAPRASDEPCRKWNTSGCMYPRCRFLHACSSCRGITH